VLLAYIFRVGNEAYPELCILSSKPDQYSVPVNVFSLPVTESSVVRIGPHEALLMKLDPKDNGRIISPVTPARMYLTPSQPDRPGAQVNRVKVVLFPDESLEVFYQQDKDIASNEWKVWDPNKSEQ
jgi:hypothetical protein